MATMILNKDFRAGDFGVYPQTLLMYTNEGVLESLYKYVDNDFVLNPHGFIYDDGVFFHACGEECKCGAEGILRMSCVKAECELPFSISGEYWYLCGSVKEDGLFYLDPNGTEYIKGGTNQNGAAHLSLINSIYQNTKTQSLVLPELQLLLDIPVVYTGDDLMFIDSTPNPGSGDTGTTIIGTLMISHSKLTERDVPNQHPMSAITGLANSLATKANILDTYTKSEVDEKISEVGLSTGVLPLLERIAAVEQGKADKTDIPDLSGYAQKDELSDYVKQDELPDLSNLATKDEIPSLSDFVKQEDLPDLSGYITKDELPTLSDFVTKDELPDLSEYVTKDEIPDLSDYAKKDEIPDISNKVDKSELGVYVKTVNNKKPDADGNIAITDYVSKNSTQAQTIKSALIVGNSTLNIPNAYTHIRKVAGVMSYNNRDVYGMSFAIGGDGNASVQYKTYDSSGGSARNESVLRFNEQKIQYARNSTTSSMPSESDYKDLVIADNLSLTLDNSDIVLKYNDTILGKISLDVIAAKLAGI